MRDPPNRRRRWRLCMMQRPGVTAPIIGASKPGHLEDALAAAKLTLSAEDCLSLEEPYRPRAIAGMLR